MVRKKNISDEQILKMALEVIRGKGPDGFTLKEVSNVTGLSPATLLQRFHSKVNLLEKAVTLDLQEMNNHIKEIGGKLKGNDHEPIEEILDIFDQLASFIKTPSQVAEGLNALKLDITDPKFNQMGQKYFAALKKQLIVVIQSGQKNKKINDKRASAEELAEILIDVYQGSAILWAITPKATFQKILSKKIKKILNIIE